MCLSGICAIDSGGLGILGYPCTSNSDCNTGFCTNSKCAGKVFGAACNDSTDCAVPLYCNSTGFCSNPIALQGDCNKENISDWTKIDNSQCNVLGRCDISQVPNKCIPIMSKPDGDSCYSSDLCQNGYCDCLTSKCRSASFYNDTAGKTCKSKTDCGENFNCDDCNNTCKFDAPVSPSCVPLYSDVATCMQNANTNFGLLFPRQMCQYCTTANVSGHAQKICAAESESALNLYLVASSCIFDYLPCGSQFYAWLDCQYSFPLTSPVPCGNSNTGTGNTNTVTGNTATGKTLSGQSTTSGGQETNESSVTVSGLWAAVVTVYCGLMLL